MVCNDDNAISIWKMLNLHHQHNNHTTTLHMRVDPTHWGPHSGEGLLCGCCDGVVYESNPYLYQYQYQYAWPVQESCRVGNSFIIKEEKITYNNILPSTPFVCVANKIVILCNSTWLDRRGFLLMVKSRRIERCYKCIFLLISWICEITCRRLSSKIKQDINFLKIRLYG
jgi:hypothetical protein